MLIHDSDAVFDRLVNILLQLHDVLLPALKAARDPAMCDRPPYGDPLDGPVLLLEQLLRDFGEALRALPAQLKRG